MRVISGQTVTGKQRKQEQVQQQKGPHTFHPGKFELIETKKLLQAGIKKAAE
jgi:hypothetical protein